MGNILHDGLDVFPAISHVLSAHKVLAKAAAVRLSNASKTLISAMNCVRGQDKG